MCVLEFVCMCVYVYVYKRKSFLTLLNFWYYAYSIPYFIQINHFFSFLWYVPTLWLLARRMQWGAEGGDGGGNEHALLLLLGPFHA